MSLDLKAIGDKIKRCREQLQLGTAEVAQGTGIEATRLIQIENGELEPSGDEILIISDFFKQDYNFFISNQKLSAIEQVDILYRKFGDSFTKADRWAIQEFIYLCECEQFLWEELKFEPHLFSFRPQGTYYKGHGEKGAEALRQHLRYDPNSISKDIYYDLRTLGLHIFRRRLSSSSVSGLFINHPFAGKCILINYEEDVFRQSFTLAHEVGHAVFDADQQINISFQTDIGKNDLVEIRANTFASNFLIPKAALRSFAIERWSKDILLKLAIQLKTNITPLLIAIKEAGLINDAQYHEFARLKVPTTAKEDPELRNTTGKLIAAKTELLERGLSTFYIRKCFEAYTNKLISEKRLAEMLLTTEFDLPKILDLFSLKLNYGS